jgi:hypothetical protein
MPTPLLADAPLELSFNAAVVDCAASLASCAKAGAENTITVKAAETIVIRIMIKSSQELKVSVGLKRFLGDVSHPNANSVYAATMSLRWRELGKADSHRG